MNELSQQLADDDQTLNEISKRVEESEKKVAEYDGVSRPDADENDVETVP